jgi:membrane-anchored glycerophosphoryl diester phosphodiesterase (GDPDase)
VGIVSVVFEVVEYAVLWALFGGTLADYLYQFVAADPVGFVMGIYSLSVDVTLGTITQEVFNTFAIVSLVLMLAALVVYAIVAGGAIKHALDDYGYRDAAIGKSFSHALGRAGSLIITQFIIGLITVAILSPLVLFFIVMPLTLETIISFFGIMVVCLIVVFYVSVRLAPTSAVVIAEDRSPMDSIKKAWGITGGQFWHIVIGQIILVIALIVVSVVIAMVIVSFVFTLGFLAALIPALLMGLLFGSITYIFSAVLYRDLESRKEEYAQDWW